MEGLRTVDKMDDKELMIAYAVACNDYKRAYNAKKEMEEEFQRRLNMELEKNRK